MTTIVRQTVIRSLGTLAALVAVLFAGAPVAASSHREAPAIAGAPRVDGSDFYMFRSYEPGRDGFVTLIANYNPLQDAYGGPNYFPLDDDAIYEIHIENDGDGEADVTFRFSFGSWSDFISLNIDGENVAVPLVNVGPFGAGDTSNLNVSRHFTLVMIDADGGRVQAENLRRGGAFFGVPFDNIGEKSVPDYAAYARRKIHDAGIPGCGEGRAFVGQRRESFAVNLGEIFDLVSLDPVGSPSAKASTLSDKNVTSLALEVPIDCLTGGGGGVIGGWTTASLPRNRVLTEAPTFEVPALQSGDLVQVSRLGMPLVNEVVIGLPDKNRFNASRPRDDLANFAAYVTNPTLPALLEALFGVEAPSNFPRGDLVATFVTGIDGLNALGVGEMQRLNTDIDATPRDQQSRLGVLGGDLAGFPNGRRPGDDVIDATLRVAMGVLCHPLGALGGLDLGLCSPADAPTGLLPYTDQARQGPDQFDNVFPYLMPPLPGSPNNELTANQTAGELP